jgi:hypothetical protein
MALPPHLERYSVLIDYLVEQLVRDVMEGNPVPETTIAELSGLPAQRRGARNDSGLDEA